MKRFKIPETGNNVILKSKKTDDYDEDELAKAALPDSERKEMR
ncbi:hypothetical protein [Lactobacillus taiwanensis]|nr:hypothetical protein [Lactobacillus taiwanensis]